MLVILPLVLLACFLIHWATVVRALRLRTPAAPGDPADFDWHFLVPCRDEEAVIGTTVTRLRDSFPGAHVWVIDDDSDDRTGAIAAGLAARDPRVHVVSRRRPHARTGKGAALNAAYAELNRHLPQGTDRSRVVVCVVDADGQLDPAALGPVSGPDGFGDPDVGGVQVNVRMRNVEGPHPHRLGRLLVRVQDIEFAVTCSGTQALRTRSGSAGLGGNGQFTRLSALDRIAAAERRPWKDSALLEDYELGLHMLLSGYRTAHLADTWVTQEGLPHPRRLLTQRTRWAQGNLMCARYAPRVVSSRHFSGAAVLEALYTFVQPLAHLAALALAAVAAVVAGVTVSAYGTGPVLGHAAAIWPVLAVLALVSVLPFVGWGLFYRRHYAPGRSRLTGLGWGLALWLYAYHLFPASVRALGRALRGRDGWAKTRRNAEALAGATALDH
ncbi:glycosyltransferase [Streptomyces boncukensis]|uniref:Glycosyltransferase n=1 Tax=Streptomyces boncukensis TaxID=2711219 RepID=A0A6G4WVU8_9ACTN|nr:glycosyltransferase [Streptomyces boncukensis]